ncbi:MAG: PaaI family thioesterase [Boseongicola sp.]|nr:PaaI family thioesterase [Boseongicola sp.]
MDTKLTLEEVRKFIAIEFPQMADVYRVDAIAPMWAQVSMMPDERHLRPGATVSGPTIFGLVDCGMYFALMATIGPEALAVTTNASIDFMRKPLAGKALIAEVNLLKVGRVLAVGDVAVRSEGSDALIARATLTYSMPPKK